MPGATDTMAAAVDPPTTYARKFRAEGDALGGEYVEYMAMHCTTITDALTANEL